MRRSGFHAVCVRPHSAVIFSSKNYSSSRVLHGISIEHETARTTTVENVLSLKITTIIAFLLVTSESGQNTIKCTAPYNPRRYDAYLRALHTRKTKLPNQLRNARLTFRKIKPRLPAYYMLPCFQNHFSPIVINIISSHCFSPKQKKINKYNDALRYNNISYTEDDRSCNGSERTKEHTVHDDSFSLNKIY